MYTEIYLIFTVTYRNLVTYLFILYIFQVVILHHMLSKAAVKARPNVLWCYKKELGFSRYFSIYLTNYWLKYI